MAADICILCKLPKGARVALPRIFICIIQGYQNCKETLVVRQNKVITHTAGLSQ